MPTLGSPAGRLACATALGKSAASAATRPSKRNFMQIPPDVDNALTLSNCRELQQLNGLTSQSTFAVPRIPEGGVRPSAADELVVGADFLEETVLDDRHAIRVVRGVEAVSNGDDRPAFEHGAERPLEVAGGPRIEQGGGLVEHERVRVGEHQPREGNLLRLCRSQRVAAGTDLRFEA